MKSLSADVSSSYILGSSHSDDIQLYTATTEEILFLAKTVSSFVQNQDKPALFNTPKCYTSTKTSLREFLTAFVDLRTDSASDSIDLLNSERPIRARQAFPVYRCFSTT